MGLAICSSCLCGPSVHSSPLIALRLFSFFLSSRSICQPDADLAQVRWGEGGGCGERRLSGSRRYLSRSVVTGDTAKKKKGISERVTFERKESDVWMAKERWGGRTKRAV